MTTESITSAFRRCLPRLVRPLFEWWAWIRRDGWTMTDSGPIDAGSLGNIPKCAGKWEWQEWRHTSGKTKYIEL